jgi:hypothetical protein
MVSLKTTILALASTVMVAADYYIDPSSVDLGTRKSWCQTELSTCPIICQQVPPGGYLTNTCDPETLQYGCVCANGLQPNVSEYSLTLPYFVCTEWGVQCVKGCGSDNNCASSCTQGHPCGALNPTRVNTSTITTMPATSTASANQVFTGLAGGSSSSKPNNNAAPPAMEFGGAYGLAMVAGSLLAGFFMML